MWNIFRFLLVAISFNGMAVFCQLPHTGECPNRSPLLSIDARKLSGGVWYENQRTASLIQWPFSCITYKIQPFFEHKSVLAITSTHRFSGRHAKLSISLKSLDPEGRNGKIIATVPEVGNTNAGIYAGKQIPAQILAMDPNNSTTKWGVVWSCRSFPNVSLHTESVWVLTRERNVDETTYGEIREALTSLNLEHLVMRDSMQNECSLEEENSTD